MAEQANKSIAENNSRPSTLRLPLARASQSCPTNVGGWGPVGMDRGGEQGGRAHPPAGGERDGAWGPAGACRGARKGREGGPTSEAGSGNGGVGGEVVGMGGGGGGK